MKIFLLPCLILVLWLKRWGYAAVTTGDKDDPKTLDLGGNEGQIRSKGSIKAKLSPCAGPYNDCCTDDPEQELHPDVTFIYASYLTQYFYICEETPDGDLTPKFFRCPFNIDDEGYHEGLFNADDSVGCYLAPPETQRKKKPKAKPASKVPPPDK